MEKTTFNMPTVSCSVCSGKIKDGLMKVQGIENVFIDLKTQNVTVDYDSQNIKPQDIRRHIADMGYEVIV